MQEETRVFFNRKRRSERIEGFRYKKQVGLRIINQANKSIGRMPRHQAPKKDVASCEKLRGAASRQRTVDIRMGKPGGEKPRHGRMNT